MTPMLSEARLARQASDGDRRAFAAIYKRYHQEIYRYCLSIVGRPEDAQDALQNTMVKALRALPGERREIKLKPWLYRVAHNQSIDLLRRRRDGPELESVRVVGGEELAETAALRERLGRLLADLGALPERQRSALVMRELGGLGYEQIGEALETSAAVARQTVYEARLGLRALEAGREMSCEQATRQLSEADGRVIRRRDMRAHLRACPDCRAFRDSIDSRRRDLNALAPLPAVAATAILQGLVGSKIAASGTLGSAASAAGVGAGKVAGTSLAVKAVATVAVVATVGVTAADRGGLIDAGLSGDGKGASTKQAPALDGAANAAGTAAGPATRRGEPVSPASRRKAALSAAARARRVQTGDAPGSARSAPATSAPTQSAGSADGNGGPPKTLPQSSRHGQETAAAHKAAGKGKAGGAHRHEPTGKAGGRGSSRGKGKNAPRSHSQPSRGGKGKGQQSQAAGGKPAQPAPADAGPSGEAIDGAPTQSTGAAGKGQTDESESTP
jgi:RNA polymerase sigma factor (sigma-70 family)